MMTEDKTIELVLSNGPAGKCVYLNDFRIAGPKPWGGGTTIAEWKVSIKDLEAILVNAKKGKRWACPITRLGQS